MSIRPGLVGGSCNTRQNHGAVSKSTQVRQRGKQSRQWQEVQYVSLEITVRIRLQQETKLRKPE
jgi:hypothetical protein